MTNPSTGLPSDLEFDQFAIVVGLLDEISDHIRCQLAAETQCAQNATVDGMIKRFLEDTDECLRLLIERGDQLAKLLRFNMPSKPMPEIQLQ